MRVYVMLNAEVRVKLKLTSDLDMANEQVIRN